MDAKAVAVLLHKHGLFRISDDEREEVAHKLVAIGGFSEPVLIGCLKEAELRGENPKGLTAYWLRSGYWMEVRDDLAATEARRSEPGRGDRNGPSPSMLEQHQKALVTPENCDGRILAGIVYDRRSPEAIAKELGMTIDEVIASARRHVARYPYEAELLARALEPKKPIKFGRGKAKAKAEPVVTIPVAFAERALPRGDREVEW